MRTGDDVETGVTPDARADLDLRWAKIAVHAGSPATAEKYARRVLDDADVDESRRLDALTLLAAATEGQGRVREAIEVLLELDARLDPDSTRSLWLSAQTMLLRCYKTAGDYALAISVGERAMAAFGPEFRDDEMMLVVSLADAHNERGDLTRARMYLSNVISRAEIAGADAVRGAAQWNASVNAADSGDTAGAVEAAEEALTLLGTDSSGRSLGRLHANLGYLLLEDDSDAAARARPHFEAALQLSRDEAPVGEIAQVVLDLARCDLMDGDAELARSRVMEARVLLDEADDGVDIDLAHADLIDAHVCAAFGEWSSAAQLARQAAETTERLERSTEAARVWAAVAELVEHADDDLYREAMRRSLRAAGIRPTRVGRTVAGDGAPASRPAPRSTSRT